MCKELEGRAKNQGLSGRTLTVEFKSDKFKNKQKSYTQNFFFDSFQQMFNLSTSLLDSAWPLEPVRQLSIKLYNLKDKKGRMSFSAHTIACHTGGKTKLGGNPKDDQPKAAVPKRLGPQSCREDNPEEIQINKAKGLGNGNHNSRNFNHQKKPW